MACGRVVLDCECERPPVPNCEPYTDRAPMVRAAHEVVAEPPMLFPFPGWAMRVAPGEPGTHILQIPLDLSRFGARGDEVAVCALVPATEALAAFLARLGAS
jgi:hypothetical protein